MKNGARAGGGNDPCVAKGAMAPSLPTRECEKDYNTLVWNRNIKF